MTHHADSAARTAHHTDFAARVASYEFARDDRPIRTRSAGFSEVSQARQRACSEEREELCDSENEVVLQNHVSGS
jgi:hypothetical protein